MIYGTSTDVSTGTSVVEMNAPDLNYVVILLMVLCALMAIDLVRRLFTRR